MAANIVPSEPEIVFTAKEEQYEKRLAEVATAIIGPEWRACWPEHGPKTRPIGFLSTLGPFGTLSRLILRTDQEEEGMPAICFVEGMTIPWSVRLGSAWKMDPSFFVHHMRHLETAAASKLLHEGVLDGAGSMASSGRGPSWVVLCGHADHGEPDIVLEDSDFADTVNRQHQLSIAGQRLNHTNLSIHRIREGLHVVVTDIIPDWSFKFSLDERRLFENQIVVRLATLRSPGHLAFPFLRRNRITATTPIWPSFFDDIDKDLLLQPLQEMPMDVDEFLYRAALVHCEDELSCFSRQVYGAQMRPLLLAQGREEEAEEWSRNLSELEILEGLRQVADRLQMCISENRNYERQCGKTEGLKTAFCEEEDERCSFKSLAKEVDELKNMLSDSFYRAKEVERIEIEKEDREIARMRKEKALREIRNMRLLGVALLAVPVVCAALMAAIRVRKALRWWFEESK